MPKKNFPPPRTPLGSGTNKGILELDRFTEANLEQWKAVSADLDSLQATLFFSLEPARRNLRPDLIAALQKQPALHFAFTDWVRVVTYQYSDEPLSSAGSLYEYGGRFNAGIDLDANTLNPWPALYLAENYATAYREKFQLAHDGRVDGLDANELSLKQGDSHATVILCGQVTRIFDMTKAAHLDDVAKVLARITMPAEAKAYMKRLRIPNNAMYMLRTGKQLHDAVVEKNWRVLPAQFGLPAQSHVMAELVRAAGFEGILYQSTKGNGKCLAIFPEALDGGSFIELRDPAPSSVQYPRLNSDSAPRLSGWHTLPANYRSPFF